MSHYSAPIGKSSYDIPYDSLEDLPLLKDICKEANRLVNSVIASNPTSSNEFALLLALVNVIYEQSIGSDKNSEHASHESKNQINESNEISSTLERKYSKQEVLDIISHLRASL